MTQTTTTRQGNTKARQDNHIASPHKGKTRQPQHKTTPEHDKRSMRDNNTQVADKKSGKELF
jgi:hypothetical protein